MSSEELEQELELSGLPTGTRSNLTPYTLHVPQNARLNSVYEDERGNPTSPWTWIEGDDYIVWETLESFEVTPRSARILLWDLVDFAQGEREDLLTFTKHWGIIYSLRDTQRYEPPTTSFPIDRLEHFASECRAVLQMLAFTERGEPVDSDLAESLYSFYEDGIPTPLPWEVSFEEQQRRSNEKRANYMRERAGRNWLDLQKRLVAEVVNGLLEQSQPVFVWDQSGRRIVRPAAGVVEIALSQLEEIFASPHAGIYICSICDSPFEPENQRQPRAGVRRFCSEECRAEGKRTTNRESWRKNGERWRPSVQRSVEKGGVKNE
jgi:hypothetical protein